MRIAHTADIHIRGLSRHDEYRQILKFFVEDCIEKKIDHIFVGGDIFHTKTTGITSEYIQLLSWWLDYMSQVATVHLILGNHDLNLSNLTRQDAITPIVEAMKNENIHLYKKSGVYLLDKGFNLCVFSCSDKEGWSKVKPISGDINIAAFHGPVHGSSTESGWIVDGDVNVDFFKDYDITLLGDIHHHQFLGYRNINGKDIPWIAYPGTPVQQNYAESIDHGYLMWEINDRAHDVQFIKLPNPKPYVTINWEKDFSKIKVPQNSRVRIKHDRPLTQLEINSLIQYLKDNCQASETTFALNKNEIVKKTIQSKLNSNGKNFHNSDTLLEMLKSIGETHGFNEQEWNEVGKLIDGYVKSISVDSDIVRNVKWSLKDLKFDNLLGYGEENYISFDKLKGIVGIFGPNRIGKSSIIGSLAYCLFNASDRGSLKNIDMINVRKQHAYARAVIDVGGDDYVIERQTVKNHNSKGVTASTAVNLFKMQGNEAIDLNGEQRNDTDKSIRNVIGTVEDFLLTTLSAQGDVDRFLKEGSTYRKKVLNRFLDIDFFDDLHNIAKQEVTSLKSELKTLQALKMLDVKQIDVLISTLAGEIKDLELKRDDNLKKQDEVKSKFESLSLDTKSISARKEKEKLLISCQESINSVDSEIADTRLKQLELEKEIDVLKSELGKIDIQSIKKLLTQLTKLKEKKVSLDYQLDKTNTEILRKKKSIKVLEDVPCGDSFPNCKFIKDALVDKKSLTKIIDDENNLNQQISELAVKIIELDNLGIEKLVKREITIQEALLKLDLQQYKLTNDLSVKVDRLNNLNIVKENLKKEILSLPETSIELEQKILEIASELRKLKEIGSNYNSSLADCLLKNGTLLEQKRRAVEIQQQIDVKLNELKTREFIANSFSKKGLPTKILTDQLPLINQQISQILAGIVDFTVELDCDDSSSLEIFINYGDSKRAIELCSGMEKMVSSIAIRAALTTVSVIPRSDIFIIDEGFGSLDESGVDSCKRLLTSLKDFFKSIIIISHVPSIKDVADVILEIQRVEKDSRVQYA